MLTSWVHYDKLYFYINFSSFAVSNYEPISSVGVDIEFNIAVLIGISKDIGGKIGPVKVFLLINF